ncbi:calcium-binding protein [Vitiosangium sp. GDMCC 1.1324]|uniref:calcium-binding protein n=1 Tax=Vitiosangium sp. (strain GDMCC 1.1324) TaxID=2138576 RepID=UPI000D33C479|nr:calcium-binding protein [Vitiosangium sp. GDMCC 1.1324]PTL82954.1 calcium-binding protein [Vitiosangium sp. GDMCC 1.1324]
MNRTTPYRRLLTAALCFTLPLASVACNPSPGEADLAVGEAASFLSTSDESGDIGADAVADASSETLSSMSVEDVDTSTVAPSDIPDVCDFSARRQEVLEKYDTNQDGKLERSELRALKEDLGAGQDRAPRFARRGMRLRHWAFWRVRWAFDEDGDKTLSTEERTALVDALEARCQRLHQQAVEKFDTNQDGKLDDTERQAAREAARQAWEQKRQELVSKYDTNGDGKLDDTERAQLREDRIAAARERRQALLAQYDTNQDGRLSTEEALPLRKEIQRRIIEGNGAN